MYYLLAIIMIILAFPAISDTQLGTNSNDNSESISTNNGSKKVRVTNFSQQLGLAAISIPEQVAGQHENILSSIFDTNEESLNHHFSYNRAGHWFYQNKKATVWLGRLTSTNSNLTDALNNNTTSNAKGLNAALNYGRLSMETALITENSNIEDSGKFYLQGTYTLIQQSSFNIAITAKVETLSENNVNYYFGNNSQLEQGQSLMDYQAKNTTLGLIGTYEVTPKWTVIGAFTSTMLDKDIKQSPLVNNGNVNIALIGTSYSF